MSLPAISDREQYQKVFARNDVWLPAIDELMKIHGLTGLPVRGNRGSHIVFRTNQGWIKLMAPIFSECMPFEIDGLNLAYGKISVKTPKILHEGTFHGWRYIIVSHIDGERIGDVFPKLDQKDQIRITKEICHVTKELQQIKSTEVIEDRDDWDEFITKQMVNVMNIQKSKGLGEKWLQTFPQFLKTFAAKDFLCAKPVFLHADLTHDHFLIKDKQICGVIDFADCRVGHPEYDAVATCVFILKNNSECLKTYLHEMGFSSTRTAEKLLMWSALHNFGDIPKYFKSELLEVEIGNFQDLAKAAFPL
jgi:hygromycin-B 7''-O-kinase